MPLCELTRRGPVVKNLVSHSNIKTKSKAHAHIQKKSLESSILKETIRLKIAIRTLRDLEHKGGFDSFLLSQNDNFLSKRALKFKRRIQKKLKKNTKKLQKKEKEE